MIDLAKRVYDHNFRIDPIVRSLLDTDFYKLLMAQMIFRRHRDVDVTFAIQNRTKSVRVADEIDLGELRETARPCPHHPPEPGRIHLAPGQYLLRQAPDPPSEFMAWFEEFRLPDYELEVREGQVALTFHGPGSRPRCGRCRPWRSSTSCAPAPSCAISASSSCRCSTPGDDAGVEKIERLKRLPDLSIADFGTRRRHGFLWQDWCVQAMVEGLGEKAFLGTSNCLIAQRREVEAVGTNAHELPMVYAALAGDDDEALAQRLTRCSPTGRKTMPATCWWPCPIPMAPPDSSPRPRTGWPPGPASGSIRRSRSRVARRHSPSGNPGLRPARKTGDLLRRLDIDDIERIHAHFHGRMRIGYGWGTR